MSVAFYKCDTCGNIITKVKDSGIVPFCCSRKMTEILPETKEDALSEKHVPMVEMCEKKNKFDIRVGSTLHPSLPDHYIEWIYVETNKGGMIRYLKDDEKPEITVRLGKDEILVAVYSYCNIHGLWKYDCLQEGRSEKWMTD